MIEIFVVIREGTRLYYLLKVVRRGFDVYCIPPHLGVHYSLHASGESHFKPEGKTAKPTKELPVALVMGEAGTRFGESIIRAPLGELGRASGICTITYAINALNDDFQEFDRNEEECFVIDKELFSKDTEAIQIGVWAVPDRNKASFEFNNSNVPAALLYKMTKCEPQIWIYAQPC